MKKKSAPAAKAGTPQRKQGRRKGPVTQAEARGYLDAISNQVGEFKALIKRLESLPDGAVEMDGRDKLRYAHDEIVLYVSNLRAGIEIAEARARIASQITTP